MPVEELAAAAGLDIGQVDDILASRRAQGRVQFDDHGRLIGIAGLTIEPTRHQLHLGATTRWTWCALDAVGILGALQATGTVQSTDPRTGNPVGIDFTDGEPQGDTTLFILGGYDGSNLVEEWCPLVNFFATPADAQAWVYANHLEGDIVSVARIAADAADMWRPVLERDAPQVC
ncbi:MAG: organomercurial lyase [Acidimicrobiia bacterium]